MNVILGIDAAWTAAGPSGVALLVRRGRTWACRCVAPSYQAFLECAAGRAVDWTEGRFRGSRPDVAQLLRASARLAAGEVDLIAIDLPLARTPFRTRRAADDAIAATFGGRGCATHSPTAARPGRFAAELTQAFARAGYPLITRRPRRRPARGLIEVYPHPALLSLLRVPYRVPYKVQKAARYWPGLPPRRRIARVLGQLRAIKTALAAEISGIDLPLPRLGATRSLAALKRYEDALDALVCAWAATRFAAGDAIPYGDATAAVWVPEARLPTPRARPVNHPASPRVVAGGGRS